MPSFNQSTFNVNSPVLRNLCGISAQQEKSEEKISSKKQSYEPSVMGEIDMRNSQFKISRAATFSKFIKGFCVASIVELSSRLPGAYALCENSDSMTMDPGELERCENLEAVRIKMATVMCVGLFLAFNFCF